MKQNLLAIKVLRHLANYPNETIDCTVVCKKPKNKKQQRQAENDLIAALQMLYANGWINYPPTDYPEYDGDVTFSGCEKLDENKRWWKNFIAFGLKDVIVFIIGAITGSLCTRFLS